MKVFFGEIFITYSRQITSLSFFQVSRVQSVTGQNHAADSIVISALNVRKEIVDTNEINRRKPGQILADKKLTTCSAEV